MGNNTSSSPNTEQLGNKSTSGNGSGNSARSGQGGQNNSNVSANNNNSNNNHNNNNNSHNNGQQYGGGSSSSNASSTGKGGVPITKFSPTFSSGEIFASPSEAFLLSAMTSMSSSGSVAEHTGDYVSCVFKWEGGGKNVFITGTFNNWGKPIQMHKSGNDFSYVQNVKRGKHAFRFVVDEQIKYSPEQEYIEDANRQLVNVIDVTKFEPYTGDDNFFDKSKEQKLPESEFHSTVPDVDDYTKEPPNLPPHLRHIILNKSSPNIDQMALPIPQHVSLNHLYCTAIKDGMMVLGSTHRYKEKYCTVVFYAMMPPSS